MSATPWSLDEFADFEVFGAMPAPPAPKAIDAERDARLEAEAYARGHADGERAARSWFEAQLDDALQVLDTAVQSVQLHESRWVGNAEENVAALAVIVARHLVQREIERDATIVSGLVRQALREYPLDAEIAVRLHPDDLASCRRAITADTGATPPVRWIADPSIVRGGCLLEGRERILDGRIDTALERAYRSLAGIQAS